LVPVTEWLDGTGGLSARDRRQARLPKEGRKSMEKTIPAFLPGDKLVTLSRVLLQVDGKAWSWRMLEFEGTTKVGSTLNLREVNSRIRADSGGLRLTWDELLAFADEVDQAVNCTLHAFCGKTASERVMEIEALDSSEWVIWADDNDSGAVESAESIASIAAG
jgi:hypothetical protein